MKPFKILFSFAFILFFTSLSAQPGNATVSKSGIVLLSADQPLNSVYAIDAETFHFTNSNEAIEYFKTLNTSNVAYRPVLENNVVMMYLQLKNHPEWTKENWAAYLSEHKVKNAEKTSQDGLTK